MWREALAKSRAAQKMTQAEGQNYCLPIIFKSEMVNDDACSLTGTETHDVK